MDMVIAVSASLPFASECITTSSFDIGAASSAVANMSGVLAGISFVALIMASQAGLALISRTSENLNERRSTASFCRFSVRPSDW